MRPTARLAQPKGRERSSIGSSGPAAMEMGSAFRSTAGMTLIELLIGVAMTAILLAVGYSGYKQFNEVITVSKAAGTVAGDLSLTRSFAIQRRENVSLIVDELDRSYVIRAADGTVLLRRAYDAHSGLPLETLAVRTDGNSVTFNSRGLLSGGGGVAVAVGRGDRARRVYVNTLGRSSIQEDQ